MTRKTTPASLLSLLAALLLWTSAAQTATYGVINDSAHFAWESTNQQANFKDGQCSGWSATADDTITKPISLGFNFNFAGTVFSKVGIMSNGVLEFTNRSCSYLEPNGSPLNVPSANWNSALSPYAADLVLPSNRSNGVTYQAKGSGINRYFVVTYSKLPMWHCYPDPNNCVSGSYTFQVIIYENGQIRYQYGPGDANGSDGAIGVEVNDNDFTPYGNGVGNGTSLLFSSLIPPPAAVGPFNAVDVGANPVTGKIFTKVAGSPFSLDIVALNQNRNAINTNYNGQVQVQLLDSSNNTGPLDSNTGCRNTWTVVGNLGTLTFKGGDKGRKTLNNIQYNNALRDARIRIIDLSNNGGGGGNNGGNVSYACSTDNFAVRPDHFDVVVSDTDWATPGITRILNAVTANGTPTHKAGRPFTIAATARNALGQTTSNYLNATPTATVSNVILPGGGVAGTLDAGTWTTIAGIAQTNAATYSEVGAFALQLSDSSFTSVDANDGTPLAQRTIGAALVDAGRFVPDHFSISAAALQNRSDPATLAGCVNPFSYLDEQFDGVFTVTAQNAAGGTTQNYTGALVKFDQAFRPDRLATQGKWNLAARDSASGTDLSARLWQNGFAGTTVFSNGVAAGVRAQLRIQRQGGAPNYTPDGPFLQSHLGINPVDGDGVGLAPAQQTLVIGGNAYFDTGTTALYFGRLAADNAYGSELSPLPMWARAQYWQNGAWLDKTDDTCTLFGVSVPAGVQLGQNSAGDGRGYWTTLDYSATGGQIYPANINGHRAGWRLWYTAGGMGGDFSISFAPHNYLISQAGLASFGHFQGNKRILYWRERFN